MALERGRGVQDVEVAASRVQIAARWSVERARNEQAAAPAGGKLARFRAPRQNPRVSLAADHADRPGPPCPTVRFDSRFSTRLERLALSVRAARERREGAGRAGLIGGGEEFAFYRPYRPGDDLRRLDWDLYARLDQAFVRVARRESAERWLVWVDTSASMGVGPPGKLQLAAEISAGLAAVAVALKGEARIVALDGRELRVRARGDLPRLLAFLEGLVATGGDEPRVLALHPRAVSAAARVFVIGDLLGLTPLHVLPLVRGRRRLGVFQILAPHELVPPPVERIRWWDPERDRQLDVILDSAITARYQARLATEQELWRQACARHRAVFGSFASDSAFETPLAEVLVR